MPTFDFEDGLFPATWKNADNEPWQATTEDANGGSYSLAANSTVTDKQISSCYIIGDFAAGDFDCDYKISSENNYDFGYIIVDGTVVVNHATGAGAWTAMTTQSLSAGVHVIQFVFIKENSSGSGTDTFYIDNVVVPTFTDLSGDVEYFPTVLPTDWTNDATNPWVASAGGDRNSPFNAVEAPSVIGTTSITYSSPADSPAGDVFITGFSESSSTADTLVFLIDSTIVYEGTGLGFFIGTISNLRAPDSYMQSVTAGSHDYEIRSENDAASNVYMFYEPSFSGSSDTTAPTVYANSNQIIY